MCVGCMWIGCVGVDWLRWLVDARPSLTMCVVCGLVVLVGRQRCVFHVDCFGDVRIECGLVSLVG